MSGSVPWWSRRWVWWCGLTLSLAVAVPAIILTLASGNGAVAYVLVTGIWTPLGLVLWFKKAEHPMGPLITLVGLTSYLTTSAFLMGNTFEQFEATIEPSPWPMVIGLGAAGCYTFLVLVVLLLFPEGRPTSRVLQWLNRAILLVLGIATVSGFLAEPLGGVAHPFSSPEIAQVARAVFESTIPMYALGLIIVFIAKFVENRRSDSIRQAQLKWLLYVLAVYLVFTIVSFFVFGVENFNLAGLVLDAIFLGLIPLAMTLAILRYHLYEIDRLVSRTVTYALVVAAVAAVFAVPVILIPSLIGQSNDLVIAGATLAAAAAFAPIRNRIQARVDRRFNRSRYDAIREVDALATKLNAAPGATAPIQETIGLVTRILQPTSIGLWLRD